MNLYPRISTFYAHPTLYRLLGLSLQWQWEVPFQTASLIHQTRAKLTL